MFSALFWYKLIFMTELLIGEGFFTYKLRRRPNFPLRLTLALIATYAVTFAYPVFLYNAWYSSLMFIALFAFSILCIKLCYDESWINVIFCGILAYTARHLAFLLYNFIVVAFNLVDAGALGTYLEKAESNYNVFTAIAYFGCYYFVYWLSCLFFGARMEKNSELIIGNTSLLLLAGVILFVDIIFNAVVVYYSASVYDKVYLIMSHLGGMVSCVLVLVIQFNLIDKNIIRREMETVQLLWHQEQEHYALSKENIDIINVKCHDLKHKLEAFRGRLDADEIKEMENAVMIYDSVVKTGNEALDVILTEKSLKCGRNGIQLTCTADNSELGFISTSDLYSLFGNIIDNAIEAVLKIPDDNRRIICLNVRSTDKLVSVHVENYYDGEIKFVDGLPQTTKKDTRFHGFGMKSVRMITEKYGGNMLARTEDGLFKLDLLFPTGETVKS